MKKYLYIFLFFTVLAGCAGTVQRASYPNAVTPEIQQVFNDAEAKYLAHRYDEADAIYANFISTYGYNALTDDAHFKRGEISFLKKNYNQALNHYRNAYRNIYSPSIAPKAQFKAAYSLYLLGRPRDCLQELGKIERRDSSAVLRTRIDSLGVFAVRAAKESDYDAIRWYLFLVDDFSQMGTEESSLQGVSDIVSESEALAMVRRWVADDGVASGQVKSLPLDEYKGKQSGGYASFKLGKTLNREGDYKEAHKELKKYVSAYPKHEYYPEARSLLGEVAGRTGEVSVKIGVILPLTGQYSVFGESVQHGIECAAGVYEPCIGPAGVQLIMKDSAGQAERAIAAVDELSKEDVIAIIGPILSKTVMAAAQRAQQLGIPLISISQREGISDVGDYIFRNTVTADSQVTTLVDYAVSRKNMKKFLVLYPRNKKGDEYRDLFDRAVRQAGGRIVAAHGYSSNRVEFASDIRGISLKPYDGAPAYDAIFIPDSFTVVGYLAPTLAMMGVEDVKFLGISRWDDPRLVKYGGKYVEGAVFPQPFNKTSDDPKIRNFVSRFSKAFGMDPTLLEALGYDSFNMIVEAAANSGAARRASLRQALEGMKGFQGVTGRVSFDARRNATRELPLLKVSGGNIVPVRD